MLQCDVFDVTKSALARLLSTPTSSTSGTRWSLGLLLLQRQHFGGWQLCNLVLPRGAGQQGNARHVSEDSEGMQQKWKGSKFGLRGNTFKISKLKICFI